MKTQQSVLCVNSLKHCMIWIVIPVANSTTDIYNVHKRKKYVCLLLFMETHCIFCLLVALSQFLPCVFSAFAPFLTQKSASPIWINFPWFPHVSKIFYQSHSFACLSMSLTPFPRCLVEGQWLEWGPWLKCSVTCNTGSQQRQRRCSASVHGWAECNGDHQESRECTNPSCSGKAYKWIISIHTRKRYYANMHYLKASVWFSTHQQFVGWDPVCLDWGSRRTTNTSVFYWA